MPQSVRTSGLPGDTARTLLDVVSCHGDGIWRLQQEAPGTPEFVVKIEQERIVDLQLEDHPNVLVRALLEHPNLPSRDRTRLRKQAEELGVCPGILCLEEGLFDPQCAAEAIGQVVDDYLVPVLNSGLATWTVCDQATLDTGLLHRVDLGQSMEEVLLRSARRHQLWDTIRDLPLMREVVAATPSAMTVISDPDESVEKRTLIESADGIQDLAEICESTADRWQALDLLLKLLMDGHLETHSSMELFQAGETMVADQQHDRALRRWRSADEKGLDDFDLGARIGRTCAITGRIAEADRRLRAHAQRCSDQLRIDAARDAWSGVSALNPQDGEARQRAIALWQRDPGDNPTLCLELARALIDGQQADAACQLLDSVGAQIPDPRIHQLHEEAAISGGDPEASHRARWRQAEALRASGQFDQAAGHYEYLSSDSASNPILLLRLTEIALERNDPGQAQQYCRQALAGSEGETRALDVESRQALEELATREEAPAELHRWLADHAQRCGDRQLEALSRQRQCQAHQREQDFESAREAARRGHQLQPENLEVALEHSRMEEQAGELHNAISILEQILQQLPDGHPRTAELVEAILQRHPSSATALQKSLSEAEAGSSQQRSIQLRLALIGMLQGQPSKTAQTDASSHRVLEILSALTATDDTALKKLQSVAEKLLQQPDPLVQLVREALLQVNPDHPLLQSEAPLPTPARTDRGSVVRTGIGGITEKLRHVQTDEGEPPGEPDPAPAARPADGATADAPKGIQSALDRLRSLRGNGSDPEPVEPLENAEICDESAENSPKHADAAPPPPAPVEAKQLKSAAARLGALREGASGS